MHTLSSYSTHSPSPHVVCLYSVVGNIQVRLLLSQKGKVLQICEGEKARISVPRVYKIMDLLREERFINLIWCKYIRICMLVDYMFMMQSYVDCQYQASSVMYVV